MQALLRERLCQRTEPSYIHSLEKERKQLFELIRRTASLGESNSILVIGPHGSGKTMILNSSMSELRKDNEIKSNMMEVHLNGLLQTDDRIALKEITRQLKLENAVGDRVFGSFAENLQFLLDALKSGGSHTKSIVFVLEEFDLFAHHKNQTLLYNLFDISQSAQTPICVVGLTCRLDVIELLEKRVKSRFSHRQLHLLPSWTFRDYLRVAETMLTIPSSFPDARCAKAWNTQLKKVMEDSTVQDLLHQQFNLNHDVRLLQQLLMMPVCKTSEEQPYLQAADFVDSGKLITTDSKASMLHGVSVLEMCLIIAMKHLVEIYDGAPFNFEMVYTEYQKFCQKRSSMQIFDKAVVMKAFEHLCALELVVPSEGSGVKTQKEYRLMSLLVGESAIMEALQRYPACPTEVKQWAASNIA